MGSFGQDLEDGTGGKAGENEELRDVIAQGTRSCPAKCRMKRMGIVEAAATRRVRQPTEVEGCLLCRKGCLWAFNGPLQHA